MNSVVDVRQRLTKFCHALVDQRTARVIVAAQQPESGFWFGGGNMAEGPDGRLYLIGRYRNAGDSRTGVAAGTRGLELAIFRSDDQGATFQNILSWDKPSLNSPSGEVLSIEGSCLRFTTSGVEVFVSTEKINRLYPESVQEFLKPGAGVWTIDVLRASTVELLRTAQVQDCFSSQNPEHMHVKDPFFWHGADGDRLGFCSHPFNWSSSNTGVARLPEVGEHVERPHHSVFARGTTWDVAMTRGTCVLPMPAFGPFAKHQCRILFYCGGECLRPLDQHVTAVQRPRGYSCEEIGGAAYFIDDNINEAQRLSDLFPLFVSPYGTGCSRYVDVLATARGYYTTWQQSQTNLSQPLVMNFLSAADANSILRGST